MIKEGNKKENIRKRTVLALILTRYCRCCVLSGEIEIADRDRQRQGRRLSVLDLVNGKLDRQRIEMRIV